jgi:2-amino-4-hydroxy-6-hydroxymethyldihydropteridine diphosphokinase
MSHGRHGRPGGVVRAAIGALGRGGLLVRRVSPVLETVPLGPSKRRYANAALLADWADGPQQLLALLKQTEAQFGRRPGRRWGARVLDCDLLAFDRDAFRLPGLAVPHARLHERLFVLDPLLTLWPDWNHPRLNLSVRHMAARLRRRHPVDCSG